jgi:hypothetical protein
MLLNPVPTNKDFYTPEEWVRQEQGINYAMKRKLETGQLPTTKVVDLLLEDFSAAISLLTKALAAIFFAALRSAFV